MRADAGEAFGSRRVERALDGAVGPAARSSVAEARQTGPGDACAPTSQTRSGGVGHSETLTRTRLKGVCKRQVVAPDGALDSRAARRGVGETQESDSKKGDENH